MRNADLPVVFSRAQALQLGWTDHAITWRARRGQWHVLRRGTFCTTETFAAASVEDRHRLMSLALTLNVGGPEVVSHLSAALAYGWSAPLDVSPTPWTTLDTADQRSTRRAADRIRQAAPLPADHRRLHLGLVLTSPARTVADCLRHLPAEESVPIADYAVASGVRVDLIARTLAWQKTWPYSARGLASFELVDGRRESWLESRSAVAFRRAAIPAGVPQVEILDERGRFVARVDYLWPAYGIVGEADGWSKYATAQLPMTAEVSFSALREEKLREDRLRDLGYEVVRWSTADALRPMGGLALRWKRAAERARPERVRGTRRTAARPRSSVDIVPAGLHRLAAMAPGGQLLIPA